MHRLSRGGRVAAVATLAAFTAAASAQSGITYKLHCQSNGYNPPEPLGDREGHSLAVGQFTCRAEGGPVDGAVLTGMQIWEYDKTNATALAGGGVLRKPGTTVSYQTADGNLALTVNDGKVTGFKGATRGVYKMATGSAASLAGKSYTSNFATSGPGQFIVETKVD